MFQFLFDIIRYPWQHNNPDNRLFQVFQFLFKEYPAFLWTKPQLKKVIILPFIIISKIIYKNPKKLIKKTEGDFQ